MRNGDSIKSEAAERINVPSPWRTLISPLLSAFFNASRIDCRLTFKSFAKTRSGGSCSPGFSFPLLMSEMSWSYTSSKTFFFTIGPKTFLERKDFFKRVFLSWDYFVITPIFAGSPPLFSSRSNSWPFVCIPSHLLHRNQHQSHLQKTGLPQRLPQRFLTSSGSHSLQAI